ncbi:hypothetical protein [Micromonospora cremea]|uniref:Uncharacterized protein n=1 Tax=Micromonospora cremea TaxID=709881 RepID=A0A1N6ANX6_9ACTN|nr:hypothetical protein [Micromonospora cremea]SIN35618.1 hypothetical protein SAMN04489832_5837 [Micromonospora cremea]
MKVGTVCDVCQDRRREAKTYGVVSEGRTAETDRCAEHAAPFEALFAAKEPRPGRRPYQATTMEEIEARKANQASARSRA